MYTNQSLIEKQLQRELSTDEQSLLTTLIPAVDLWVNNFLGSNFKQETTVETRHFSVDGGEVDIDPCQGITAITLNDENGEILDTYEAENYRLYPLNKTVKNSISFRGDLNCYPSEFNTIAVTAKFTEYDDGIPPDIQIAATRIASQMIGRSASGSEASGIVKESIEGHSVDFGGNATTGDQIENYAMGDTIVRNILDLRKQLTI